MPRPRDVFVFLWSVAVVCFFFLGFHLTDAQQTSAAPNAAVTQAPQVPQVSHAGSVTNAPAPLDDAYLGDLCYNTTHCTMKTPNSECKDAGDNTGNKRCRCTPDYYAYNKDDITRQRQGYKCGKIVTTAIRPECRDCEDNEGTCIEEETVAVTPGGIFCQCPISRSGRSCETIHVNVSCSMLAMKICYSPHQQVNFSDGWLMYTSGKSSKPLCRGVTITDKSPDLPTCDLGNEELALSLNASDIDTCGTTHIDNTHNKRFMNSIEIQKFDMMGNEVSNSTPMVFNVFCSFTSFEDQTFPGFGIGRVNGNDRGTQVDPTIAFWVTNQFGQAIGAGVTLFVGDRVRFVMSLKLDDNYEDLQVMRCTASTSAVIPDSTAETRALMSGGCPVPGEVTADSWYWEKRIIGRFLNLTSGAVPIFKLPSSNYLYNHCALKLCMIGDSACLPNDKATCQTKTNRRKRDSYVEAERLVLLNRNRRDTANAGVTTGMRIEDPNQQQQNGGLPVGSPGFIALLVILAFIALVLIIVTTIVAVTMNRRKKVGDETNQSRPQLFALPRISRTHERF